MLSRIRVPLGFVVGGVALYLATPTPALIGAGMPLAVIGLLWRAAAAGVIRKDHGLASGGPYRWTRNPLYFGSLLLALGFSVMSGRLACAVIVLAPFALIYPGVIRREQAHLGRLFGEEYAAYARQTPAFFPRRIGPSMFDTFSFALYRTNGEYNAALGFGAVLAILLLKAA